MRFSLGLSCSLFCSWVFLHANKTRPPPRVGSDAAAGGCPRYLHASRKLQHLVGHAELVPPLQVRGRIRSFVAWWEHVNTCGQAKACFERRPTRNKEGGGDVFLTCGVLADGLCARVLVFVAVCMRACERMDECPNSSTGRDVVKRMIRNDAPLGHVDLSPLAPAPL